MTDDFDSILGTSVDGIPDSELLADLRELIVVADRDKPRSQQRRLGPSEVGHPCQRKLAYGLSASRRERPSQEHRGYNHFSDPLPAIMGTAVHAWLEDAVKAANERLGRIRWIPEQKVTIRDGLSGTCDLYDVDTGSVIDFKVPGVARYKEYVAHGPSEVYRGQFHLYGKGYANLGFPVQHVAGFFICRTGSLRQTHLWREPYSPRFVDEILSRIDNTEELMVRYDVEHDPRGFKSIPITPDDGCSYCAWHSVSATGPFACRGQDEQ